MVYTISSDSDFEKKLIEAGSKLVLVDFYAKWCVPCLNISPSITTLSRRYSKNVVVLKVDVDKLTNLTTYYKIVSMPTFIYIKNKRVVGKVIGADFKGIENKLIKLVKQT